MIRILGWTMLIFVLPNVVFWGFIFWIRKPDEPRISLQEPQPQEWNHTEKPETEHTPQEQVQQIPQLVYDIKYQLARDDFLLRVQDMPFLELLFFRERIGTMIMFVSSDWNARNNQKHVIRDRLQIQHEQVLVWIALRAREEHQEIKHFRKIKNLARIRDAD